MNIKNVFFDGPVVHAIPVHISLNKPSNYIYLMKDIPKSNYPVDFGNYRYNTAAN
jgi:hypothetical protein